MTIKTEETTEQQRMSGDTASQWSQACIIADAIIGSDQGGYGVSHELGVPISFVDLLKAYSGFCKQNGQRTLAPEVFGKACADMFGPRKPHQLRHRNPGRRSMVVFSPRQMPSSY